MCAGVRPWSHTHIKYTNTRGSLERGKERSDFCRIQSFHRCPMSTCFNFGRFSLVEVSVDFSGFFKSIWIKCAILQFSCNRRSFRSFIELTTSISPQVGFILWKKIQLSTRWVSSFSFVHIDIRSSQKLLNLKSQLLFPKKNWFVVAEWRISFFSSSTE